MPLEKDRVCVCARGFERQQWKEGVRKRKKERKGDSSRFTIQTRNKLLISRSPPLRDQRELSETRRKTTHQKKTTHTFD